MKHKMWKRVGAFLLSGAMVFTNPAVGVLAEEIVPIEGETGNAEEEEMPEAVRNEEEALTEEILSFQKHSLQLLHPQRRGLILN